MGTPESFLFFFGGAKAVESESGPPISYAGSPFSWWVYADTVSESVTNNGGSFTSYAVQAGSLPTGISLNTTTGAITGTATEDDYGAAQSVTIRATGPSGTSDAVISITVKNPTSVAGCTDWIDFNAISTLYQDAAKATPVASDGDPIGCVADKSGNGLDFTQTTTAKKPTYKTGIQNSLSVAYFDGTDDVLDEATRTGKSAQTIFVVASTVAGFADNGRCWSHRNYSNAGLMAATTGNQWKYYNPVVQNLGSCAAWGILAVKYVTVDSATCYYNGAAAGTNPFDPLDGYELITGLLLGGRTTTPHDPLKCYIGEFIVYNSALSDANRGLIEDYLGAKWGITVA